MKDYLHRQGHLPRWNCCSCCTSRLEKKMIRRYARSRLKGSRSEDPIEARLNLAPALNHG